jgi:hypothetical protein
MSGVERLSRRLVRDTGFPCTLRLITKAKNWRNV